MIAKYLKKHLLFSLCCSLLAVTVKSFCLLSTIWFVTIEFCCVRFIILFAILIMMCNMVIIDFVMLKILIVTPTIKCSMSTIGCVMSW